MQSLAAGVTTSNDGPLPPHIMMQPLQQSVNKFLHVSQSCWSVELGRSSLPSRPRWALVIYSVIIKHAFALLWPLWTNVYIEFVNVLQNHILAQCICTCVNILYIHT